MKKVPVYEWVILIFFGWVVVSPFFAEAEEGMWPVNMLSQELIDEMQAKGLALSAEQLYNTEGTGVANAVVSLGGGTGAFVSPEGLILTNHHVAFGAVQQLSSAENNYIDKGFLARTRVEEPQAFGYNAYVLLAVEDVTKKVTSRLKDSMTTLERQEAIERVEKEIVKKAEKGKDVYCSVAAMHGGLSYELHTYLKIKDLRVVYVPPASIGNYGGDIDNWMWPRHTGDFSFLRAYVGPDGKTAEYSEQNVPYHSRSYLKIAPEPTQEGDFTMIAGYPGRTYRHITSYDVANDVHFGYPARIELFQEWLGIMRKNAAVDPEAGVRMASIVEGLENTKKNSEGMLEGFQRFHLLDEKLATEKGFEEFLNGGRQMKDAYGHILPGIKALYDDLGTYQQKRLLMNYARRYGLLSAAHTIYKWNMEREKPDLKRDPGYMDRDLPEVEKRLQNLDRRLHLAVDRDVLAMFLRRLASLPSGQGVQAVDEIVGDIPQEQMDAAIRSFLDGLYSGTRLTDAEARVAMLHKGSKQLLKEKDPFIMFAARLYPESEALQEKDKSFDGGLSVYRPQWAEALMKWQGQKLYPDANGTLRVNYGSVKGYSPRNAIYYEPFTTLSGVLDKYTGEDPFDLPPLLFEIARKDKAAYQDPVLKDIPVDLLTTNDSTGGNSGSPVMNGKGELIGLLFDGNYESITGDYFDDPRYSRTINVDIRYILFIADKLNNAQNVLQEMGVSK